MKINYWKNKTHGDRKFTGYYRFVEGEREFILSAPQEGNKKANKISFESWQAAKKLGWKKE
jgi:hypothetical protein